MRRRKDAAPGVGTTGSGRKEKAVGTTDFYPGFYMRRGPVSSILLTGKENALPGREIRCILGLNGQREVTALVEQERRGGVPICASCDGKNPGYYLPASSVELQDYTRSLQGRIREVSATLNAMEVALYNWTGQQRLDMPEAGGERG